MNAHKLIIMTASILAIAWAGDTCAASAHDPQFENKALWPMLDGKEWFTTQRWDKARLLVWSHAGAKAPGAKYTDAKNWLENGQPATTIPDENTDVLFPDAPEPYKAGPKNGCELTCRNLTIGSNAWLYSHAPKIYGNVWIKRGALHFCHGPFQLVGSNHAFFRNDSFWRVMDDPVMDPKQPNPHYLYVPDRPSQYEELGARAGAWRQFCQLSQYLFFSKPEGSMEVFGVLTAGDEFRIFDGVLIASRGTVLQGGRDASPEIMAKGTLALLDGAYFGKILNECKGADLKLSGKLLGGLPDRPLSMKDCHVGLSFMDNDPSLMGNPDPARLQFHPSVFVGVGSTIKTYSKDLKKARMVIGWSGLERDPKKYPNVDERYLRKVSMLFFGPFEFDGVRLEDIHKGGLVSGTDLPGTWKNIEIGKGCDGDLSDLFMEYGGRITSRGCYPPTPPTPPAAAPKP